MISLLLYTDGFWFWASVVVHAWFFGAWFLNVTMPPSEFDWMI